MIRWFTLCATAGAFAGLMMGPVPGGTIALGLCLVTLALIHIGDKLEPRP